MGQVFENKGQTTDFKLDALSATCRKQQSLAHEKEETFSTTGFCNIAVDLGCGPFNQVQQGNATPML